MTQEHPLVGVEYPPVHRRFDARDVALYALGVGAGTESLDQVYEGHGRFAPLPTFPLVLTFPDVLVMGIPDGSDLGDVLHGEQSLELHAPIPVAGVAVSRCRVVAARDKGGAGIFDLEAQIEVDGVHVATATYSTFVKNAGGWGGSRGRATAGFDPTGDPEILVEETTSPTQALVYRLSGDLNPLHVDPEVARVSGHERPILHGLGTLGTAVRIALGELARSGESATVWRVDARFSGPVLPGERIRVSLWRQGPAELVGRVDVLDRATTAIGPLSISFSS